MCKQLMCGSVVVWERPLVGCGDQVDVWGGWVGG